MAIIRTTSTSTQIREDITRLKDIQVRLVHLIVCDKTETVAACEHMRNELIAELGRAIAREEKL